MASPRPVSDTFSSNRAPRRRQPWTVVLECDGQAAILALARRRNAATSPFETLFIRLPKRFLEVVLLAAEDMISRDAARELHVVRLGVTEGSASAVPLPPPRLS